MQLQKIKKESINIDRLNRNLDTIAMHMEAKGIPAPADKDNQFIANIKKLDNLIWFYNDSILKTVGISYFALDARDAYLCLVDMQDELLSLIERIDEYAQDLDDELLERKYITGRTWTVNFAKIDEILSRDPEKSRKIHHQVNKNRLQRNFEVSSYGKDRFATSIHAEI